MASMRANSRLQVGSASWISEEQTSASQIAETEAEEFAFSARNEIEWLNEHMAEVFSQSQVNVAEIFKTPGKLRGKTPRTVRKANALETRAPLSDVFSATPKGAPSPFKQAHFDRPAATFQVAEDIPEPSEEHAASLAQHAELVPQKLPTNFSDSGYHGSQLSQRYDATQPTQPNEVMEEPATPEAPTPKAPTPPPKDNIIQQTPAHDAVDLSGEFGERSATENSFQSAREEQSRAMTMEPELEAENMILGEEADSVLISPLQERAQDPASSQIHPPLRSVPALPSPVEDTKLLPEPVSVLEDDHADDVPSPSDGSSPIRPIVRKSSLNFASLPAREPITTKKSIGNRVSRTSQLDHTRNSHYGRQTGGKSLGGSKQDNADGEQDDMDLDAPDMEDEREDKISRLHNKTSTQRLQDQISMLGKSQSNVRPSKSIANTNVHASQPPQTQTQPIQNSQIQIRESEQLKSPQRKERSFVAPGAFPEDEDDSWIGPPNEVPTHTSVFSPRPQMTKSYSTDVMEDIHDKDSIGGSQFNIPKRGDEPTQRSPVREPIIPDRINSTLGHAKSVSTSVLQSPKKAGESPGYKKSISVSNPDPFGAAPSSPSKSPLRNQRGSPLKAAKDKFSSILKTSRGLFASSAAVSAEAKTSTLSPPSSRMGGRPMPSFDKALRSEPGPELETHIKNIKQSHQAPSSPGKAGVRQTRASTEREERKKEEDAREAKEAKEAQRMAEELEKARSKVKEEARVYHLEQERVAAMQKEVLARKEQERLVKARQAEASNPTRTSPRKTKAQVEAEGIAATTSAVDELSKDVEMADASEMLPTVPRTKTQIGRPGPKRPLKPAKEAVTKNKPPTVIRVDTGSQRGHQYHPSTSTLAATLQETLPASTQASSSKGILKHKASTSSIQSKASSTSSFKSAASKALEAAAKKKEQDELNAQRKREAKQEIERQRAAIKEEERRKEEQQRRQEAARLRELQREREQAASVADAKKSASRQAIERRRLEMEKAKQTGAPPPAIRQQPSGDSNATSQEKALPPPLPQRVDMNQGQAPRMNSTMNRPQDDLSRSINSALHNTEKVPPKRPLQQETGDEHHSRPTIQRNPPSYHHNDAHTKRRKTGETFDEDDEMPEAQSSMAAPPIRQSYIRPKDIPTKSIFHSNGYTNAPQPASLQRSAVISQHNMQVKTAHPLDMAQVSKAPIPFASSANQANSQPHKTPARPGTATHGAKSVGKSAAKSSPRYQNGENIDLPEINTDSEDDDSDAGNDFAALAWTESPALRKQLAEQEIMDPVQVFGQPGPLNMEEVFSKSKDRFHKFRARTSSANWTGQDRLTEDEIKKDLEARDRVRRQGGWTYDSMV